MKILTSRQMHTLDEITMKAQNISSEELMERASQCLTAEIVKVVPTDKHIKIFCGPGNNGGDGSCIARMLYNNGYDSVQTFTAKDAIPEISDGDVVIDALFGTGLNRKISGVYAEIVERINSSKAKVISIDIPSGLSDFSVKPETAIKADLTLKIHSPSVSMLLPENEDIVGSFKIVGIGLENDGVFETPYHFLTESDVRKIIKPRKKFAHKGVFGHSLLVAGAYLKGGAAVLASRACHRAGTGLLTTHVPESLVDILQISSPETMLSTGKLSETEKYSAVGIGPGIGQSDEAAENVRKVISTRPAVLDADALNIVSARNFHSLIQKNSVLTPHVKEFERLFGKTSDSFERLQLLRSKAGELQSVIILKGAHTQIAMPDGSVFFNTTGNPGMAAAGSGDVLTGIITALLSQKYSAQEAALLGVYVHGLAGDLAAEQKGFCGLTAGDIVETIPFALKKLTIS